MSVESLAIVLHHSRATGTAKLVLIGIANHDGDGGAWPTVDTLARYANCDKRSVQRALDRLEKLGELHRIFQAGGDHNVADHRRPNRYQIRLECPPTCDRSKHHRTGRELVFDDLSTGVTLASPGDTGVTRRGDTGVTQTILKNLTTKTPLKSLDPAARASELRARCAPPFDGHDFDSDAGYCRHACGVRADGLVIDPKTGDVLVEAEAVIV